MYRIKNCNLAIFIYKFRHIVLMTELDPILKTVCVIVIAMAILIIAIILYAKNNPIFAHTIINFLNRFTDEVSGYNPNPTQTS